MVLVYNLPTPGSQVDEKRPYPANLCPLFGGAEFAGFGENLGEPIGEPIETMSGLAVRQRTAEHLNGVLSEEQRIDNTFQTGTRRNGWRLRLRGQMPRLRAGHVKLTLQVGASDLNVLHCHFRFNVAQ